MNYSCFILCEEIAIFIDPTNGCMQSRLERQWREGVGRLSYRLAVWMKLQDEARLESEDVCALLGQCTAPPRGGGRRTGLLATCQGSWLMTRKESPETNIHESWPGPISGTQCPGEQGAGGPACWVKSAGCRPETVTEWAPFCTALRPDSISYCSLYMPFVSSFIVSLPNVFTDWWFLFRGLIKEIPKDCRNTEVLV